MAPPNVLHPPTPRQGTQDRVREGFQNPFRFHESPVPSAALMCSVETNRTDCEDHITRARSYHSNLRCGVALGPESVTFQGDSQIGAIEAGDGRTDGSGKWREDESTDCARAERLKERLRRKKGKKLLLASQLPTPQLNSPFPVRRRRHLYQKAGSPVSWVGVLAVYSVHFRGASWCGVTTSCGLA